MVGQRAGVRRDVASAVLGVQAGIAIWSACFVWEDCLLFLAAPESMGVTA